MTSRRFRWSNELIIFGFFLALYVLIFRGDYASMDEMGRYGLTKTLVLERDITVTAADGTSFYIPWPPLQSIAAIPLFIIGWVFAGSSNPIEKEEVARLFVTLFCPIVSALGCVVFYRLCRQFTDKARIGLLTTLVFGLCTITLPYSRMFFSEPFSQLLLMSGILLAISSTREKPLRGILAGLLLAFAAANNYVIPPVFGLVFIFFACQEDGWKGAFSIKTLTDVRLWALIFFVIIAVGQGMWYNYVRFGVCFRSPYYYYPLPANAIYPKGPPLFSYPLLAGIYGFVFSPMRSVFLYSPPLIGALLMWPRFIREHGRKAILLLAIPIYYMLIYAKTQGWHAGYSWGPRYLVPVTGLFLLPFMYYISDYQNLRRLGKLWVATMLVVGFYVQLPPTLLNPLLSYDKVLTDFGGQYNELMILHLPQACSVTVQTELLKTISGPADTDLYFLKHLNSGTHLFFLGLLVVVLAVMIWLLVRAIRQKNGEEQFPVHG